MIGNLTGLIPPLAIRDDHKYIMYSDMITEVEASNNKVKIPNASCDTNGSRKKRILLYLEKRAFSSNDCKNIRVDRNLREDVLSGHLLYLIAFKNTAAYIFTTSVNCLKKNQNAPKRFEHPPVRGENIKTFRWDSTSS